MTDLRIVQVSADEVSRALAAYRGFQHQRGNQIALQALQNLIDCPGCLAEQLRDGDDPDSIRDQLRTIAARLIAGG